jgi:hypothetical protein
MALGKRLINTGSAAATCNTDSVQVFGADNAYSSNIALYQLDGNDDDTTGSFSGTSDPNVTYSATGAKFGQAATFNGSSSYIALSGNPINGLSNISISFWIKPDDVSSDQYITTFVNSDGGWNGFGIRISSSAKIQIVRANSGTVTTSENSTASLSTGSWKHIVVTSSQSELKIYIDGVLDSTHSISGFTTNNTGEYNIGALKNAGSYSQFYDGVLDEVRVFNKVISSQDVSTLYAETSSTASDTNPFDEGAGVALYTFDYDASEASGYYDGTPSNVDFGVGGKINTGVRFNGSDSSISITDAGIGNNATARVTFSVSIWVKTTSTSAAAIVSDYDGIDYAFYLQMNANGTLQMGNYLDGSGSFTDGTATINDGNWHNLVLINNTSDNTQKLFIDGNNSPDINQTLTSGTKNAVAVQVGYYASAGGYVWDGEIDQLRFFTSALSESEMDTLYAETACTYTATTTDNAYPTTNLAYYKLDNSAEDEKGSYDGTESNIEYRFGRFGQALKYSGASSNVETTLANSNFTSNYSISFWVNLDNANVFQNFTGNYKSAGGYGGFTFMSRDVGSGVYRFGFIWWTGVGGNYNFVDNLDVVATSGTWAHLVATKASSTLPKLYVNGTANSLSYDNSATEHGTTGENLTIGNTLNTNYSAGLIDQVRVFSSELSSSQVTELYNEKPETDTSNFKTVLWDGTGGTQYISNVGFQPDLVWIKKRSGGSTRDHMLYDSVRGAGNRIRSNQTTVASNATDELTSFDANGFFLGSSDAVNGSSSSPNYVAWVWKGGGDAVTDNSGDVSAEISANTDLGFSIVKYNDSGTGGQTVAHGLDSAPTVMITKTLDTSTDWVVYTTLIDGGMDFLKLNDDAAAAASSLTVPTSQFIYSRGQSSTSIINYLFHSVTGVSKMGIYDGGTNGIQLSTGFKASWIMIKKYSSGTERIWYIYDTKRDGVNDNGLFANLSNAESSGTNFIDFNDTNIQINATGDGVNGSGSSYLYMAFK